MLSKNSRPLKFLSALLVTTAVGCATQPKAVQETVSPGMDKDQVLNILGNPSRSKRVSGADRWSYDQHIDGKKTTVHVYFKDAKVSFVGSDEEFEKSLKKTAAEKQKPAEPTGQFKDIE
jgi:outer membrane protein assembly factor BamE (lipoprotein component of BamABCDE complex)